ncbi:MAG: GTPase, partial [Actinomycetes bacterium]
MSENLVNEDSFKSTDEIWISNNLEDSQDVEDLEKNFSNEILEESIEHVVTNRPRVSLIGRPNVGKSTLINRIIGRREAVVQDIPGVTKDRVYYDAQWNGKEFILIDTGGWTQDSSEMMNQISTQVQKAIDESDLILFVLDFKVGITQEDEDVIKLIRKTKTPVLLIA